MGRHMLTAKAGSLSRPGAVRRGEKQKRLALPPEPQGRIGGVGIKLRERLLDLRFVFRIQEKKHLGQTDTLILQSLGRVQQSRECLGVDRIVGAIGEEKVQARVREHNKLLANHPWIFGIVIAPDGLGSVDVLARWVGIEVVEVRMSLQELGHVVLALHARAGIGLKEKDADSAVGFRAASLGVHRQRAAEGVCVPVQPALSISTSGLLGKTTS